MKKSFSRKSYSFLIFALTFFIIMLNIAGCNQEGDTDSSLSISTVESLPSEDSSKIIEGDGLPDTDLGEYVFTVADVAKGRWEPQAGESAYTDAIIARNRAIEERFNIKIEVIEVQPSQFFQSVQPPLMAGDKFADILICQTWQTGYFLQTNLTLDLRDIPFINLDGDHWNQNATELLTVNNIIFGSSTNITPHKLNAWVIYFNKRLINDLNLENPYDLYEQGEWTFDKFREMGLAALSDLNGDGVMDTNDRYGFSGPEHDFIRALFMGSGEKIVISNPDGSLKYNLNNSKAIDVVNKMKQMITHDGLFYPKPLANNWTEHFDAFANGQTLFYGGTSMSTRVRSMEDDFGMVPMPNIDGSNFHCAVDHNAAVMLFPNTNPDFDKTGLIVEALAYQAKKDIEVLYAERGYITFRDDKAFEIFNNLDRYMSYDKFALLNMISSDFAQTGVHLIKRIVMDEPTMEAASSFASVEEMAQMNIDDFFNLE